MRQGPSQISYCVCFLLVIYWWAYTLPIRVACFPSESPLEETRFLFARGYLLKIASGVHFSFQLLDPIWYRPTQTLCMLVLWVNICVDPVDFEGLIFLVSSIPSGSYALSISSLKATLIPKERF